ncbi:hypothetical protein LCGC14_2276000, partial [marine sediment metagenome]
LSYLVTSQVVQTQVIELTERVRDFFVEATKGNIVGQTTGNVFAQNDVVGTIEEDIQSQGGTLVFLQNAQLITLSSSDAADTIAGANARTIEIVGLDENFIEISEIVNLLGTSDVNTTQEYIRINRLVVNEVGTYTVSNAGIITATAALSATVQIEIPLGEGVSKSSHYTVPAGQRLIVTRIFVSVDTGKEVDIMLKTRANADDTVAPFSPVIIPRIVKGISVPINAEQRAGILLDEKTDIWGTALTSIGTSEVEINVDFVQYAIGQ